MLKTGIGKIGFVGTNLNPDSSEDETMRVSWMVALALCLGFLFLPLGFAQGTGSGGTVTATPWTVAKSRTKTLVGRACCAETVVVVNQGNPAVTLQRKGSDGDPVGDPIEVPGGCPDNKANCTSPQIGLQPGESLTVTGDSQGGSHGITTATVP